MLLVGINLGILIWLIIIYLDNKMGLDFDNPSRIILSDQGNILYWLSNLF